MSTWRSGGPFGFCLNTGTLRGQQLTLTEEIEIAAKAGYDAIEPWIAEITQYVERGGSLKELKARLEDLGLSVESAIGFAEWVVDDDAQRAAGLEQAKRDMRLVAEIGGKRLAAPPAGAVQQSGMSLMKLTERYRALLELGKQMGVVPQLELWGFSQTLSKLGEVSFVAVQSGHPQACLLLDVYHLYKGDSSFTGLNLLNGAAMHVFHVNDYPADPPRETITDADRVYPGDGVAPLGEIFRTLHATGYRGVLSLELFNKSYWQQPALNVAREGLEKTREVVRKALG